MKVREEGEDELKIRLDSLLKDMHDKEKELSQAHEQIETLDSQIKVKMVKYEKSLKTFETITLTCKWIAREQLLIGFCRE